MYICIYIYTYICNRILNNFKNIKADIKHSFFKIQLIFPVKLLINHKIIMQHDHLLLKQN